jgi:hypothetical protein
MTKYLALVALLFASVLTPVTAFAAAGFAGEPFQKVFYLNTTAKGSGSGANLANAKAFADADLMSIEAGTVITKVFVIVDTAITGTTNLDVGDDDDADGFVDGSLSVTLGTPGMYGWNAKVAGAYLRVETAGATDAADVYVVPNAKYYSAAGKEVKLDVTGTNTAGAARVIVEGYKARY